jgi:hypothetical protein
MERFTVVRLADGKYAIRSNVPGSYAFCKINGADRWNTEYEANDACADLMDIHGYTV